MKPFFSIIMVSTSHGPARPNRTPSSAMFDPSNAYIRYISTSMANDDHQITYIDHHKHKAVVYMQLLITICTSIRNKQQGEPIALELAIPVLHLQFCQVDAESLKALVHGRIERCQVLTQPGMDDSGKIYRHINLHFTDWRFMLNLSICESFCAYIVYISQRTWWPKHPLKYSRYPSSSE